MSDLSPIIKMDHTLLLCCLHFCSDSKMVSFLLTYVLQNGAVLLDNSRPKMAIGTVKQLFVLQVP